ncbi:MAG: glycosyltransferase [Eggerthellaceae bacterium]|jgi:galactofuranosylgalactofuranosylrhamnosyl-N-acetylglucosaminyl-diphospho-decaprenol beta-1,5/1,6-galactofuranosyltransferase
MKTTTTIMKRFKLANVLFEADDFLKDHVDILYRADDWTSYDKETGSFSFSGEVDFCTYFNAISVEKWRRYTDIMTIRLHLEIAGDPCRISLEGLTLGEDDLIHVSHGDRSTVGASQDFSRVEVDVPFNNTTVAGFKISSEGTTTIRNAYYYTLAEFEKIHPVDLALCITTFKKEEYVIPNIERIKRDVLGVPGPLAERFHLYVVDNGRTLDAQRLSDEGVTVLPNDNVGGSGGFARGMIEAMNAPRDFTHVILMDDDVRVSPESFRRLYALLSLANSRYALSFVNGAMLELERPNIQFEDISFVRDSGGYQKIKPDLSIDKIHDIVTNESIDVERDKAYGAWWFSCIPMSCIRENGLPLPFFVRCDDVEYGMRCEPTYMTMNGICVWHSRFIGRFRASVDCYQYVRNMLITIAVDNCSSESLFMLRFWRIFHIYLRSMNYSAAELWLDGLRDYLKGPDFLMSVDGADLMKANSAKNEKLEPIEDLDPQMMSGLHWKDEWLDKDDDRPAFLKALETIPHDRHRFPRWMLRKKPGVVAPNFSLAPWTTTAMRENLVVLNAGGKEGTVRHIDRARYRELIGRYHDLRFDYRNKGKVVAEQYRDAFREMTSQSFWKEYLHLQ